MPVRIILLLLLVNFSSMVLAQSAPTQIRGPKNADSVLLQKQFGPLTPSDTLWRIAEQVKPSDSVTTFQVMYALFMKNPGAFNDANFNHLRPGAILIVPELREIRLVDPEVARRKADSDDAEWAKKVARDAAARAKAREEANKPNVVQQQTAAELNALKDQYQDSIQLIEGIALENQQLRGSLGRVEQELEGLKAQLAEDSLLQQQLNQLLQQQQQILAEQQARREAEEAAQLAAAAAAEAEASNWLNNPITWALAASLPAILLLMGFIAWVKRRGRQTEEAVANAIKEPQTSAGYKSPVPPIDNSQDFDESLLDMDDDLFKNDFDEVSPSAVSALDDSLEDDTLPDFSDDILINELVEPDPLRTDMLDGMDDDRLDVDDDALDPVTPVREEHDIQLEGVEEFDFDPDNILSDTDLSALLMADDDDDVIELADPSEAETAKLAAEPIAPERETADDVNDHIEEIEVELPDDEPYATPVPTNNDELEEAAELNDDVLDRSADEAVDAATDELDADDIDELLLDNERERLLATEARFDNSDLDDFAEQLAAESIEAEDADSLSADEEQLNAELDDILEQAAAEQSQATAPEVREADVDELTLEALDDMDLIDTTAQGGVDDIINDQAAADDDLVTEFELPEETELAAGEALIDDEPELAAAKRLSDELSLAEDIALPAIDEQLNEQTASDSSESSAARKASEHATSVQQIADLLNEDAESDIAQTLTAEDEFSHDLTNLLTEPDDATADELAEHSEAAALNDAVTTDTDDAAAELTRPDTSADEEAVENALTAESSEHFPDVALDSDAEPEGDEELLLDLASDEDNSVTRPSEAALSVENPSKVLDSYPELAMSDDTADDDEFSQLAEQIEQLTNESAAEFSDEELAAALAEQSENEDEDAIPELSPEEFNLTELEDSQFDSILNELAVDENVTQADNDVEQANDAFAISNAESTAAEISDEPAISDDDFVEIDNLLSAMEHADEDEQRFNQLNVDVGLEDYAGIIGEHTKMDVDKEDEGFAGKLDLIRAYLEMDEAESAELLIGEILTSNAPEHIKAEVKALRAE
ncbi:FimV/HubP family polar landmark protein [Alishewanella sp. SMS8]|uniref:FimV/HubP family polar landmark protein n=1 Tax=Alishewanella sp. SMS8 TaxID=2994676 RepID=UPI002740E9CF|nr:FimV/HubP family polar landmark protein [Alishewanella sp. SMS8]MDP5458387.1 FimV/HubP family polar landmark protein [Alishewanella sp. SMS8]